MELINAAPKETIWNKNYLLCMLVSATSTFAQSMFNPAMPVYGNSIGLSADIIGLITCIATFICMFGRGISGKFSDIMSKKRLVYIGLVLSLCGYGLFFFANSLPVFFMARVLQTVGSGMQITVLSALAIAVVPSSRIPSAIAIFSVASSLAQCFAPNIGTNLAYNGRFSVLFTVAFFLLLLAALFLFCINEGDVIIIKRASTEKKKFSLHNILCVPAIPAAILLLFNGLIHTCITSYLSLYGIEKNLPDVGIFFTINAITMIAIRPVVGKICDSKPLAWIIIPGYLAEMITGIVLATSSQMVFVYLAAIFYGLGFGSVMAAIQIMAVRSVGPSRRGEANGTYYVGGDVGLALGAYIAGAIINVAGASMMYWFMAAMAALSLVFYFGYCGAKKKLRSLTCFRTKAPE